MRRAAFPILLVLGALVAALLLIGLGDPDASDDATPSRLPAGAEWEGEPAGTRRQDAGEHAPTLSGSASSPRAPVEVAPPSRDAVSLTAGWVEVKAEIPDGWDPDAGFVYALPAGSPGVDDEWQVAHARLDYESTLR